MKKCPYCAESIQDEALKCRFCGEFFNKPIQNKWYLKTSFLVIAFLCVGPLMLPLILINPAFSNHKKIIITLIIVVITIMLTVLLANSIKSISGYYKEMLSFGQ